MDIRTRTLDSGQVVGAGENYRWWQCSGCGMWINGVDEAGRWTPRGLAYCPDCTRGYSAAEPDPRQAGAVALDVPPLYAMAELADFPPVVARRLATWPKTPMMGVSGKAGRGKTHAIWAVARKCQRKGRLVRVLCAPEARSMWIASRDRDGLVRRWVESPLLALDDVTRAPATEGWAEILILLLDQRAKFQRATLVATMDDGAHIDRTFGPAMRSRLSAFEWVVLGGADRRRK